MRRRDRKPHDPKMLVHVPHAAGTRALELLRNTYGQYAPDPIKVLIAALTDGAERHGGIMGKKPQSRFNVLLQGKEATFETPSPDHAHRIKSGAHNWARYHGCRVATRSHPAGTAVTVYLLKAPA